MSNYCSSLSPSYLGHVAVFSSVISDIVRLLIESCVRLCYGILVILNLNTLSGCSSYGHLSFDQYLAMMNVMNLEFWL